MAIDLFLQGTIIGFSIAAPVGPIGLLCIRRTLAEGALFGIVCGLGAATADAVYGSVAGLGFTFISDVLIAQKSWLRLLGGLFLLWLGLRTFLSAPAEVEASTPGNSLTGEFASTFFLPLTNPMTITSFTTI
jgi:threonine/homoserine/homoserine lactone efflux protein